MNPSSTHTYMFVFFFFLGAQYLFGLLFSRKCLAPCFLGLLISVYKQDMFMPLLISIPLMALFLLCLMHVTGALARVFVCLSMSLSLFG